MFYLLFRRYHLTSKELWSAYFDQETYTVLTHQQIPLLLAKSALSCWMYPTAQITLYLTPSHPWVPPEWPYCQQAQRRRWFTVKHIKAGLQTSSHPQNSASHLLGSQGPQQRPQFFTKSISELFNFFRCSNERYIWILRFAKNCAKVSYFRYHCSF